MNVHRYPHHRSRKRQLCVYTALAAAGLCAPAQAAFFQIQETSVSTLGYANAGAAAVAQDASTIWYNPAGMTRLGDSEMVLGAHVILPSFDAKNVEASAVTASPISGGGEDAGESALVPNFYYSRRLNDKITFGVGVNAPYGLATDYDDDWGGRYHALHSAIHTVNINPAIAFKVNDQLSLGLGLNYQILKATLSQAVDFATICTVGGGGAFSGTCGAGAGFNPNTNPNDGDAEVNADDKATGFNFGVLWELGEGTRVGFAHRSKMEYDLDGKFDIDAPGNVPAPLLMGGGLVDSDASAEVTLPATTSLSLYHRLDSQWELLADWTRTNWSDLPELRIEFDSTQADSVVTLDLDDANRYSIGAVYSPGGNWVYRAGFAIDESPVPNAEARTPRLPDADRTWLAFGAGYRPSNDFSVDIAFVHVMLDDAKVDKSVADAENQSRGNLEAKYEGSVNILSVQGRWSF